MKRLKSFKRGATYLAAKLLSVVINRLPRRMAIYMGSWLGLLVWLVMGRERHHIRRHLTLAYSDRLNRHEMNLIGRQFFVNSARNLIDIIRFQRHFRTETRDSVEIEGLEHFDRAYLQGRGIIGVTGHIGNFELLAAYMASRGYNIGVIGRKLYDERIDEILVGNRETLGITNFYTTDSPRKLLKWLHAGNVLGVLMDTDSSRVRSMFVPSFGRLSYTPVGHIALAIRARAAIVPLVCVRISAERYRVVIRPPIEYEPDQASDEDIYQIACRCNQVLEELITSYPDQWIWIHNKWHTNPDLLDKP